MKALQGTCATTSVRLDRSRVARRPSHESGRARRQGSVSQRFPLPRCFHLTTAGNGIVFTNAGGAGGSSAVVDCTTAVVGSGGGGGSGHRGRAAVALLASAGRGRRRCGHKRQRQGRQPGCGVPLILGAVDRKDATVGNSGALPRRGGLAAARSLSRQRDRW